MAVDQPAVEKAPFTTVTNKKTKGKGKVPSFTNPFAPSQNVSTPAPVVSRAPPLPPPANFEYSLLEQFFASYYTGSS